MKRLSSLLIAGAALTTGVASSQATPIFSATFDSQSGTSVNGVTGGTATLKSTGLGTCTVETANSMGDGGYLRVALQPGANYNVTTKLYPASSATSLNALMSNNGTALNGGFDFFMRVSRGFDGVNYQKPASLFVDPPTNGVSVGASGGWASTSFFGLGSQAAGTFSNWDEQVGSQYSSGRNVLCGNQTDKSLVPGTVYHMAAWLSTDVNGLVTAKYFIREGTDAIDTSSDTDLTGRVTFNVNAPGGLTTGEMDFGTAGNWGADQAAITLDYDSFRLYSAAPASFDAIVPQASKIHLSWTDNAGNETGFEIDRATNSSFTANLTTFTVGANVTSYDDTTVNTSDTYYYRVRATNTGGDSANSNSANATLSTTPSAPSGLSATTASSSQINLAWTDNSSNETGFKIERATDSGFTQNLTLVTTTAANVTSYSNTGLTANTTYYYRVRATNAGADSANSSTASATTSAVAPAAPSGLAATAVSSSQISLSWIDNSSNETGFRIDRATNASFTAGLTTVNVGADVTSYTSSGLVLDTTYYYRVAAIGSTGNSAYTTSVQGTLRLGDANLDGQVDLTDLTILAGNWQATNKIFSDGDFNGDGTVDLTDLTILAGYWQTVLPTPAAASVVNEVVVVSQPVDAAATAGAVVTLDPTPVDAALTPTTSAATTMPLTTAPDASEVAVAPLAVFVLTPWSIQAPAGSAPPRTMIRVSALPGASRACWS